MRVLVEENPISEADMFGYYGNPCGRRRNPKNGRKTVAKGVNIKQWTQGVSLMDVVAGVGGWAAAGMVPGMVIKGTEVTPTNKILKVLLAIAATAGVGYVAKMAIGAGAAKAAVIGGLAGTGTQLLTSATGMSIGRGVRALPAGRGGVGAYVAPSSTRQLV